MDGMSCLWNYHKPALRNGPSHCFSCLSRHATAFLLTFYKRGAYTITETGAEIVTVEVVQDFSIILRFERTVLFSINRKKSSVMQETLLCMGTVCPLPFNILFNRSITGRQIMIEIINEAYNTPVSSTGVGHER
jgi:hypothetical protein